MTVADKFCEIGTRLQFTERGGINVLEDRRGEYFTAAEDMDLEVLQVDRADRHLLLLVRDDFGSKSRFLCGHDERHYFAAAVPQAVSTIRDAKKALMPDELADVPLKRRERGRRKTSAYKRQGEWFFVPAPDFDTNDLVIHRNEPFNRGRGKFHYAEEMCRLGGESVYMRGSRIIPTAQFSSLPRREQRGWHLRQRDAVAYVRGRISHSDHATIVLRGWHRVVLNTENQAAGMSHLAFID